MINKIVTLSSQLRESGLPVSIRSTQSATQVYMDFGEADRQLLKTALMAIYVKDRYDIPKFNKIFEEVFKKEVEKEVTKEDQRGTAYKGGGPKSNRYIIKKNDNAYGKIQKESVFRRTEDKAAAGSGEKTAERPEPCAEYDRFNRRKILR